MPKRCLYLLRYDLLPTVGEDYANWTQSALERGMSVPGWSELRAFQAAAGAPMINLCMEFPSSNDWASWCYHDNVQTVIEELTQYAAHLKNELWEPSPMLAKPVYAVGAGPTEACVRYVLRWDLRPETMSEYESKAQGIWERALQVPGLSAVSAYRAVAGAPRAMLFMDFPDLEAWARWYAQPVIHEELLLANSRFVVDTSTELWMPNPRVPVALHPVEDE